MRGMTMYDWLIKVEADGGKMSVADLNNYAVKTTIPIQTTFLG